MNSFFEKCKTWIPLVLTEGKLGRIRAEERVSGQNQERQWWGREREALSEDSGDAFFTGLDDFYLTQGGSPTLDLKVDESNQNGNGNGKSMISKAIEAVTGGWVTVRDQNASSRSIGRNWTLEQLWAFQDAAWIKATLDPRGVSASNNIVYYTIGNGLEVTTPNPEVNEVIEAFRNMNDMELREKNIVREMFIEGEYPILFFIDKETGDIRLRKIAPREITEIETHKEDTETVLAYHRQRGFTVQDDDNSDKWYADYEYYKQLGSNFDPQESDHASDLSPDRLVLFMRHGFQSETRGRPPMTSVLRFLKYYEDFIIDRIRLHHERAKVVWIRSIQGSGKDELNDNRRNPMLAPKGGTMWTETPNVRYRIESAKLESADAEKDGLLILYSVAAGLTQPIHILEQRADQSVYSSLRKSDSPFSQMIESLQHFHSIHQEKIYRLLLNEKVLAGELPEEVKIEKIDEDVLELLQRKINELVIEEKSSEEIIKEAEVIIKGKKKTESIKTVEISIGITFPDVVKENPLDDAKVLLIHQRLGIVSKRTMAARSGYDWREELRQMRKEREEDPEINNLDPNKPGGVKTKNDDLEKGSGKPGDIDRSVRRSGSGRLDNDLR